MAAQQRELLQQLMRAPEATLRDPTICKAFCVKFCVNDLFDKTKQVKQPCPYDHNKRLQQEYQRGRPIPKFEAIFKAQLDWCLEDCQKRKAAAEEKIEPKEEDFTPELLKKAEEVMESEKLIEIIKTEVEYLVNNDLAKALEQTKLLQERTKKHDLLLKEFDEMYYAAASSGHQKLVICDICGSTLSMQESDEHLGNHFQGKLHRGFVEVRLAREAYGH